MLRSGRIVNHAPVALPASLEMLAQGESGGFDILPLDGLVDAPVLHLDLLQIVPALLRRFGPRADRLARNDDRPEKMHEAFKIGIAGCRSDRPVKGKVGLDSAVAGSDRCIDGVKTLPHAGKIIVASLLGRDAGGFLLDRKSKLQHVLDLRQRTKLVGNDTKCRVGLVIGDEYARSLAANYKSLRPQRGHGLAYHRAADTDLRDQLLLRRHILAARHVTGAYLARKPVGNLSRTADLGRKAKGAFHQCQAINEPRSFATDYLSGDMMKFVPWKRGHDL